jgi:hypothetical protein
VVVLADVISRFRWPGWIRNLILSDDMKASPAQTLTGSIGNSITHSEGVRMGGNRGASEFIHHDPELEGCC